MLPYKFIDLKGSICYVDINVNFDENAPKQDYLTVGWLHDNYKPLENLFSWKRLKCRRRNCVTLVTFVNRDGIKFHYTAFSTYKSLGPLTPEISVPPKSWNQVSNMCKELNASLPDFESKDRISEFVALLKLVPVADMDAIPIDLRYNYRDVGIKLFSPFY